MSISVTPIPRLLDLTVPAFTLGTNNAAGAANTAIASDSTLLAFDTTLPAAVGTSAVGTATTAGRRDHVHAGNVTQATQAAIEAETNEDTYAAPDMIKYSPGVAKVWGQFQVNGTVNGSYNLLSVTVNASGNWSPVFDDEFSGGTYSIAGGFDDDSNTLLAMNYESFAVGSVNIRIRNDADTLTNPSDFVTFMAMGDQ